MIRAVLVAIDGSAPADRAIDMAADLARMFGARLTLLHVIRHEGSGMEAKELAELARSEHVRITEADLVRGAAERVLEEGRARARAAGLDSAVVQLEVGDPATHIVEVARAGQADVIIMGRRGRGDLTALLLGSVSHKVAQLAPCACMTVP